jgi:hypothetical protein
LQVYDPDTGMKGVLVIDNTSTGFVINKYLILYTYSSKVSEPTVKPKWIELVNESVHTIDDIDIGDIDAVNRNFVVVKRGFVNTHYYYIPMNKIEGWDGHALWLKITEDQVKTNYERNTIPDPTRYYIKDYPYYNAAMYPEVVIIQPRYKRPVFTTPPAPESPHVYKCDLCNTSSFSNEDELGKHVVVKH